MSNGVAPWATAAPTAPVAEASVTPPGEAPDPAALAAEVPATVVAQAMPMAVESLEVVRRVQRESVELHPDAVMARDRMAASRIFAILFGEPKLGKTLAMARMFPKAWWFANLRGLQGMQDLGVYPLGVDDVLDLDTLYAKTVERFGTPKNPNRERIKQCPAIVGDDINLLAETTKRLLDDPKHPEHAKDGRMRYAIVGDKIRAYLMLVDGLGLNLGLTMHELLPSKEGGLGGPKLTSKAISAELPKYVDFCYRMVSAPLRRPWPAEMWTSKRAAPDWILGERRTVTPRGIAPPNLAEIVRATGVHVDRHPGIESIAIPWVENIAVVLQKTGDPLGYAAKPTLQYAMEHLTKARTPTGHPLPMWAIDWILQDAMARAEIRLQQSVRTLAGAYGL